MIIENVKENTLKNDLTTEMVPKSRVSIAAACFSIYAYKALQEQFANIEELRFLFTSPSFLPGKSSPELDNILFGSEFEAQLRNDLTQKAIAKECADWIKSKVKFYANKTGRTMQGFMGIETSLSAIAYNPLQDFTTVDIGCSKGDTDYTVINKTEAPESRELLETFNTRWSDSKKLEDVTAKVLSALENMYEEHSPEFIYFMTLTNIFNEFLETIFDDVLQNEATGFKTSAVWNKLYNFQQDAALSIINMLERFNGCILADSVGLGKTFTALAVIKYYENHNKNVLVLCPKKLSENWNTYSSNYKTNPFGEKLSYDVLFHTDLSRDKGMSNGQDLQKINWGNYDLVVIDESHNFRNGGNISDDGKENRYDRFLNRIIRVGRKTKVLMLSATPVNNRFLDLKNQLQLAYEGDTREFNEKLGLNIDGVFNKAQEVFTEWSKQDASQRTTEDLLLKLDSSFFSLLESVTIARSRKHIEQYYNNSEFGKFPIRKKPITHSPPLTKRPGTINYSEIYESLLKLNLSIYTPSEFIPVEKLSKYFDKTEISKKLSQRGREKGVRHLMMVNLLKRLESSVCSFKLTMERIQQFITDTIKTIDNYSSNSKMDLSDFGLSEEEDLDSEDSNSNLFTVGKKIKIDLSDMNYSQWRELLIADRAVLADLLEKIAVITPEYDYKLETLKKVIEGKVNNPINDNNRKIIVFTAFADTAEYLYTHVSNYVKTAFNMDTAIITGSKTPKSTNSKIGADFNDILTCFSPISKEQSVVMPDFSVSIDVLIATDCISEGQNLQDCDWLINYDIHWNPVRIIQRFGRIDRLNSHNKEIQLVNFWPDMDLDAYIKLKSRVEAKMKAVVLTSTGDDNPIDNEDSGDLEYRRQQLARLKEEVVDIEDVQTGVSILDLGLNEFRLDLMRYNETHKNIADTPHGLYTVVASSNNLPPGVIYVLKNTNKNISPDRKNRLHPFYMVYISDSGRIVYDYLSSKKLLDAMRLLCLNNNTVDADLFRDFNSETGNGCNMELYTDQLQKAINSILGTKKDVDIGSMFRPGGTRFLDGKVKQDGFEVIAFLIVKAKK